MKNNYRQMIKRSFLFFFCLLLSGSAEAAGNYTINGVTVAYTSFSSSPSECWVYANNLYQKIWGVQFTSDFRSEDNLLKNLRDEELTLTEEHLKNYVSQAALGSSLRICNSSYLHSNDGWGHSQIIVQKDEGGFAVLEGGLHSWPYCQEKYYTWSEYINTSWLGRRYAYIKYIKWPGAVPFNSQFGYDPIGCVDVCYEQDGMIYIQGWAADRDMTDDPVQIQIQMEDDSETGKSTYLFSADGLREDVEAVYTGIGQNHGFSIVLQNPEGEKAEVDIYALNIAGGNDVFLGHEEIELPILEPETEEEENPEEEILIEQTNIIQTEEVPENKNTDANISSSEELTVLPEVQKESMS